MREAALVVVKYFAIARAAIVLPPSHFVKFWMRNPAPCSFQENKGWSTRVLSHNLGSSRT
jgi:hypothetical protein